MAFVPNLAHISEKKQIESSQKFYTGVSLDSDRICFNRGMDSEWFC